MADGRRGRRGGAVAIWGSALVACAASGDAGDTAALPATTSGAVAASTTADVPMADDATGGTSTGAGSDSSADPTTGPALDGICYGYQRYGWVSRVYAREGIDIDQTCYPMALPCGGDPVGSWTIVATCGQDSFPNPIEADCPSSTFEVEVQGISGSTTFVADGTFSSDVYVDLRVRLNLDTNDCFGIGCGDFQNVLAETDPGVSCGTPQTGGCSCTFSDPPNESESGTWQVDDDTLITEVLGEISRSELCVNGDRLELWAPILGEPTITSTPCATAGDCVQQLGAVHDVLTCEPA